MTRRPSTLLGLTAGAAVLLLSSGSPALAATLDDGEVPAEPLGLLRTLLLYVGAPVAIYAVITLLVLAPGMTKGSRYRPAQGWSHDPVWFAGPEDPVAAVAAADRTAETKGGASGQW